MVATWIKAEVVIAIGLAAGLVLTRERVATPAPAPSLFEVVDEVKPQPKPAPAPQAGEVGGGDDNPRKQLKQTVRALSQDVERLKARLKTQGIEVEVK